MNKMIKDAISNAKYGAITGLVMGTISGVLAIVLAIFLKDKTYTDGPILGWIVAFPSIMYFLYREYNRKISEGK